MGYTIQTNQKAVWFPEKWKKLVSFFGLGEGRVPDAVFHT